MQLERQEVSLFIQVVQQVLLWFLSNAIIIALFTAKKILQNMEQNYKYI